MNPTGLEQLCHYIVSLRRSVPWDGCQVGRCADYRDLSAYEAAVARDEAEPAKL